MYKIPANTVFVGKNLVSVSECHSTNTEAFALIQTAKAHAGTVVITDHQTNGRGQRGSNWEAQPGMNLTFSIILQPKALAVQDQFYLNMVTALALHDFLNSLSLAGVKIKWPNDMLVDQKKN